MPFDLTISFSGMCLYVPDPIKNRMHVLMPRSGPHAAGSASHAHEPSHAHTHNGHNGHNRHNRHGEAAHPLPDLPAEEPVDGGHGDGVEPHVVRMFTDPAHLFPGIPARTGTLTGLAKLDQRVLDLSGLDSPGLNLDLSGLQLGDVSKIVGQHVPRSRLDGPDERVFCRVSMGGGAATGHAQGAVWEVDGVEQPLTYRVEWTMFGIETEDGILRLRLRTPDGTEADRLPALHPVPRNGEGNPTIELHLFHTPENELPPWPRPTGGKPSGHHFMGLYDLFDHPAKRPVPRFVRPPKPDIPGPIGVDPARCMAGSGSTGGG